MHGHRETVGAVLAVLACCAMLHMPTIEAEGLLDPDFTHKYVTTYGTHGLLATGDKALKFPVKATYTPADIANIKAEVATRTSRNVKQSTESPYMDNNGIVLLEDSVDLTGAAMRTLLAGMTEQPQFIGDVYSSQAELGTPLVQQMMTTPYLYVSYVVPEGGGTIDHLLVAYGGSVFETYDLADIGVRGYVLEFPEDADLFHIAELFALDEDVRGATPEFLEFGDSLAGDCPWTGANPNPSGCGCELTEGGGADYDACFALGQDDPQARALDEVNDPLYTPFRDVCFYKNFDENYVNRGINLHLVNAVKAWETTTGSPQVRVAVLDAGVGPHQDNDGADDFGDILLANEGYDSVYDEEVATDLHPFSHGTTVAGIIAARRNNGVGIPGIAGGSAETGGVRVVPVRGITAISNGDVTNYALRAADAILWIAGGEMAAGESTPVPRASVVNMSMGNLSASQAVTVL